MTGSRFTVSEVVDLQSRDGLLVIDTITLARQRPGAGVVPGARPVGPES